MKYLSLALIPLLASCGGGTDSFDSFEPVALVSPATLFTVEDTEVFEPTTPVLTVEDEPIVQSPVVDNPVVEQPVIVQEPPVVVVPVQREPVVTVPDPVVVVEEPVFVPDLPVVDEPPPVVPVELEPPEVVVPPIVVVEEPVDDVITEENNAVLMPGYLSTEGANEYWECVTMVGDIPLIQILFFFDDYTGTELNPQGERSYPYWNWTTEADTISITGSLTFALTGVELTPIQDQFSDVILGLFSGTTPDGYSASCSRWEW